MSAKTYHRAPKGDLVTMSRTELDRDGHLSVMARMIMVIAAGCKDDFRLTVEYIVDNFMAPSHGRDAVRKGMAQLRLAGHAKFKRVRIKGTKLFEQWYEFYEVPLPTEKRDKVAGRGSKPRNKPAKDPGLALNGGALKPENPTAEINSLKPGKPVSEQFSQNALSGPDNPTTKDLHLKVSTAAATAAAADTHRDDGSASPPSSAAVAAAVAPPSAVKPTEPTRPTRPLKANLTPLELRRAQLANPALRPLGLWQLADLYADWKRHRDEFEIKKGDITKRRKKSPDELDWQWFQHDVTAWEKFRNYVDHLAHESTRSPEALEAVNADQGKAIPCPDEIEHTWRTIVYEGMTGRTVAEDRYPDEEPEETIDRLAPDVPRSWGTLPPWHRALLAGRYIVGPIMRSLTAKPKAPATGSAVNGSGHPKAFPKTYTAQDRADLAAVQPAAPAAKAG